MCGIVGAFTKAHNGFSRGQDDAFYQMLFADTLRGDDSTGIIVANKDSSFGIMKDVYPATYVETEFRQSAMCKDAYMKGKVMIGHNRKATIGGTSPETAHPFVVNETFAMVHNGTLRNHKALADTVVDSEALAIHLSKVLVEDFVLADFEEAIGKVNGAYAIAAFDQKTEKVYLTRNSERPMAYVETPEGVYFASELLMLYWICSRNNLLAKDVVPQWLKADTLLTIDINTNKVTEQEYTPKKATPVPMPKMVGTGKKTITGAIGPTQSTKKEISKSHFKRMYKHYIGRSLEFYADDYVEKDYPNTIASGSHEINLMGESDLFSFRHAIHGEFDLYDLSPGTKTFLDCLYSGTVANMEYNKQTGFITFDLMDIKKTLSPILMLTHHENKSTVH